MGPLDDGLPVALVDSIPNRADLAHYLLPPRPFFLYSAAHFVPADHRPVMHAHPCVALHGCLDGPICLQTPDGEHQLEAGMFYLIGPGVLHGWRNPGRRTATTFGLWLDLESAAAWRRLGGSGEPLAPVRDADLHAFDVRGDAELHSVFWQASDRLLDDRPRHVLTVTGLLMSMLGLIVERLEGNESDSGAPLAGAGAIRRLLISRLDAPLTVKQIARDVNLSPRHAERLFHAAFGASIMSYFNDLKIDRAKRLLGRPDLTVDHISRQLGFSSPSYFSRAFARHTGCSPSEFRTRHERT